MAYSGINVEGYVGCTGCVDGRASVFILNFSLLGCNETYRGVGSLTYVWATVFLALRISWYQGPLYVYNPTRRSSFFFNRKVSNSAEQIEYNQAAAAAI
jgi:hypothetical protein